MEIKLDIHTEDLRQSLRFAHKVDGEWKHFDPDADQLDDINDILGNDLGDIARDLHYGNEVIIRIGL